MKILLVSHGLPPSETAGVELYTFSLAKALVEQHHRVHVFCRTEAPNREEFSVFEEESDGLRITRVVNNLTKISTARDVYDNAFLDEAFTRVLKTRPDVVHVQHFFGLSANVIRIAKSEGVPVLLTLHDFFVLCPRFHLVTDDQVPCPGPLYGLSCVSCLQPGPRPRDVRTKLFLGLKAWLPFPVVKWTKRFFIPPRYLQERGYEAFHRYRYMVEMFKGCDRILVPSRFVRDLFLKYYPGIRPKLMTLPLGIPSLPGSRRPSPSDGRVRFCYFGNILPFKGLHLLIEAYKGLPPEKAALTIYGGRTPWTAAYYDQLRERASGSAVDFRGPFEREDLPRILEDQDVVVLPSICAESFSFVLREAHLLGLPVIASRIGALPEAVREGVDALLFPPGDGEALRDCMLRFIREPALATRMSAQAPRPKSMTDHASELSDLYGQTTRKSMTSFSYADYESRLMDRDLIRALQQPRVRFFEGCRRVLDLACGSGIFMGLLRDAGIEAVGVDRNPDIVKRACQSGLRVTESDVFHYLAREEGVFDGIFCSHLLEHLPFDRVVRLVELITKRLTVGGKVVFVFPNPESIRLHLFAFWRDPEHVRFYTANLITAVCQHNGLTLEFSNEGETPNRVEAPLLEALPTSPDPSRKENLQGSTEEVETLVGEWNQRIETFNQKMRGFSEAVNRMWAADDEVVLVFRK